MPQFKYHAFISYSHADRRWADWLHKALETYPIPQRLVGRRTAAGTIPKRLAPVFRDRDELPSATDLNRKVNEALAQSDALVVICSPHSASSRWVDEEVRAFKRLGREQRVFCLIVDGEPDASDMPGREAEECFAPALRHRIGADGVSTIERTEPIAADARPGKDGKTNAKLKLLSGLLDVGFDELRQREQQRRVRRLGAIAALALLMMVVTSVLAIQAVIARKAAERRQQQSEELVNFMLGDLNDKLAQVGRLDIMASVDDQAMRYFKSLPIADVTDEALAQRAKALEKIGDVHLSQGQLPAAQQAFEASLQIAESLLAARPDDPARQLALARAWTYIGTTHWYQGGLDEALQVFESAQSILKRVRPGAATDTNRLFELATVDNNIGHILESRGQMREAEVQYRSVLELSRRLVVAQPDDAKFQVALGNAHNNLGKLALMRGDLVSAVAEYSADNQIESALSARDPKDNSQRENVLIVRQILGNTLALTGDTKTGIQYLREAAAIAEELHAIDPDNASVQEDMALCAMRVSRLLRLSGDTKAGNAQSLQALSLMRALSLQDPKNTGWKREFAEAGLEQAAHLHAVGQADAARMQIEAVQPILEQLLAQQDGDRNTLLATMTAALLSAAVNERSDPAQAMRQRNTALKTLQAQENSDLRLLALQVEALLELGRQAEAQPVVRRLWAGGYRDPTLLAVLRRARIDYPENPAFRKRLQAATGTAAPASIPSLAQE